MDIKTLVLYECTACVGFLQVFTTCMYSTHALLFLQRPLNPPDMHALSSPFSPPGPGHMDRSPCPPLLSYRPRLTPAPGIVLDTSPQFSPLGMPPPLMGGGLPTPTVPLPPQPQAVVGIQPPFTSTDIGYWPSGVPPNQFAQQRSGSGSAGSSPSVSSPRTATFNPSLLKPQWDSSQAALETGMCACHEQYVYQSTLLVTVA